MAIFFCVGGGPFGLESLIQASGPTVALILIVATPIFWALPVALMTAELSSAMPNEGGYYVWVQRAFGPYAGFLCAWFTWIFSWIDVAIYPVQFTEYLGTTAELLHLPHPWGDDRPWLKWILGLIVIVPCTWLNIRGARPVGKTVLMLGLLLLAPFVVMVFAGLHGVHVPTEMPRSSDALRHAFGAGFFVVLWNYLGFDSLSTIAEEVENPRVVFPKALGLSLVITLVAYLLPVLVGLAGTPEQAAWTEGSWPTIVGKVGGPVLAISVSVASVFSQGGQFMSNLLGVSRAPMALAQDGRLPAFLGKVHPRYGTPWAAILTSAGVYTVLSFQSFQDLVKFDVLIYSVGMLLELAALAWLRKVDPDLPRPFKIPGGALVLTLVVALPTCAVIFGLLYLFHSEPHPVEQGAILLGALATGPLAFWAFSGKGREVEA